MTAYASANLWTVIGEWSSALTDCARWLNGRGVGARWDNTYSEEGRFREPCDAFTGSYRGFSDYYKEVLGR